MYNAKEEKKRFRTEGYSIIIFNIYLPGLSKIGLVSRAKVLTN